MTISLANNARILKGRMPQPLSEMLTAVDIANVAYPLLVRKRSVPPVVEMPSPNDIGPTPTERVATLPSDMRPDVRPDVVANFAANAVVKVRPDNYLGPSFDPLQEWEGFVVAFNESGFKAHLIDKSRGSRHEEEEAEFSMDDVSESDRALVVNGAIFRWALGYERTFEGTRRKVSLLVFRRLPAWTKAELQESFKKAEQQIASITWE